MIEGFDFLAIPTKGFLRKIVSISISNIISDTMKFNNYIFILFKNQF